MMPAAASMTPTIVSASASCFTLSRDSQQAQPTSRAASEASATNALRVRSGSIDTPCASLVRAYPMLYSCRTAGAAGLIVASTARLSGTSCRTVIAVSNSRPYTTAGGRDDQARHTPTVPADAAATHIGNEAHE